jgi:hypothetical protein
MPNALQITSSGNGPAGQTSVNGTVSTTSTTLTFTQPSSNVALLNTSAANNIYITLGSGPATASMAYITPGIPFNYNGPPITQITILGSAAGSTYSLWAY